LTSSWRHSLSDAIIAFFDELICLLPHIKTASSIRALLSRTFPLA
jgi:hypothetical protein